ncbi:hypothetical protein [Cohnella sp. GCM10027633]|uniref:hypothetical protein n=1 Tax=unclassified Cohnella TaxID=2636738 RepID=UPI00363B0F19
MKRSSSGYLTVALLALALTATACAGSNSPDAASSPSAGAGGGTVATQSAEPTESSSSEPAASERPEQGALEVRTADGYQSKTAALKQGEGFSLYTVDGFTFDSSSGRLALTADPEYYVDIERLQDGYDIAKVREETEKELNAFGAVSDYSGELVEHPLGFAELYLQSSGEKGIRDAIVWKAEDGASYLFRLHNPKGEEAPAFAGAIFVLLSTVK